MRQLFVGYGVLLACLLAGCGAGTTVLPSAPSLAISTGTLTFATTVGSSSVAQTVTLTNTGGQALTLAAALSDSLNFSATTTCSASLPAGGSCAYSIQFTPRNDANFAASLTFTDNSGDISGSQQVVKLNGTSSPAPAPVASLAPSALQFAPGVVNMTSAPQTITLTNSGTAPLSLQAAVLSDLADFSIASTTCQAMLQPAASCTYAVLFTPQAVGPVSGTFTLSDNSGGVTSSQQVVTLSGTGLPVPLPQLTLGATSLSFAPTTVKTSAAPQTLTLTNTGTAPLNLTGIRLGDSTNFSLSSTCGAALVVNAACAVTVTFTPQSTGALSSTLTLTDNSGLASGTVQQQIALSGSGTPAPAAQASLTPAMAAFGSVNVGSVSAVQVLTLTNSGNAALTVSGIALSDTVNFALTNACGATLAPGASCALSIAFQPHTAGPLSATLTATDNSGGNAGTVQTSTLSGTGAAQPAPLATLSPATLVFPDTMQTQSSGAQLLTLNNTGAAPLVLGSLTLSDTQNFSLYSGCGAQLAPAASCTVSLIFHPQTIASFQATLTLVDNSGATDPTAAPGAQQTVALTAKGIAFAGPRAEVSPLTLLFPQTVSNSSAAPQTVTLTNTGTSALTVSGVTLAGTNAAAYSVTANTCTGALPAGASCTATVIYSPTLGSKSDAALLVFTDDSLGKPGSTQTATLTGSALAEVDSVENFGDSITCGFYAQPHDGTGLVYSLEGYAGLFDTWLGVPAQNWCRQGDTAADLSRQWVPWHSTPTSSGNQLFTLMIGTNDAYRYGIPQSSLQTYAQEVGAALAWLAIPDTDKILANAISQRTGNWTQDVGFGVQSTDNAASLTFTVNQAVAGRSLYLVYHVWALPYGQAGKATIAVDGVTQATVDESQNSLVNIPTENGTTDTFLVQTVALGAVGPHTVTFTSAGPNGSAVGLLWAGVPAANYAAVDGAPRVMVGLITNSPSGNQTFAADIYNLQLKSLIPAFVADGMNITLVPTDRVLDPNSDFVDILHPDNAGHAKLAAAFEQYR